ncbi:tyrosine-protein kinase Wsck [Lycorma delicatula]|uniref:tyrosine-protein kinase Wsck n=1 Tax=Lycorma delicatula TaxID=130591 RepID=UPI003F5162E2
MLFYYSSAYEVFGQYVGCLKFMNESSENFYVKVNTTASVYTIDNCLNACLQLHSYRYGGVQLSKGCMCMSYIQGRDEGDCQSTCPGNSTQICGGKDSLSIYASGHFVPGPPESLEILNKSDLSVEVRWSEPQAMNGLIEQYAVSAHYLETHAFMPLEPHLLWSYPNSTYKADLLNLHPGTLYNISVFAKSPLGDGSPKFLTVWTHIGDPTEPEDPEIVTRNKNSIIIRLKPYRNDNGPVTAYRIIIISDENAFFEPINLKTWSKAQDDDIPYYVAAELTPEQVKKDFVVGDDHTYGRFFNPAFGSTEKIRIVVAVKSTFQGITKFAYSQGSKRNTGIMVLTNNAIDDDGQLDLTSYLLVAIVLSALLLCGLFVTYFVIRRRLSYRRRRAPYRQELTLQGPIIEVVNDGYIPEELDERVNYYEKLQQQVWSIPRSVLEIKGDVLCQGQFGAVFKGVVQQRGLPLSSIIYVVEDGKLTNAEKRSMLQDLGVLIRCSNQPNILVLIGTCEVPDTVFVVLENYPITLKEMLLKSRCLEQSNGVYQKFSSVSEISLLQMAVGIARGMNYLSSIKVVHKQLAATNVAVADGGVPKVTGFGLASFYKLTQIPDYTRWTAQEVFKRCSYTTKSDVWSFGCLLWEMSAVGGTPYSDIQSTDVSTRVIHGLRLPQMRYIGDELYHLMLQCWQIDLDERPSFQEIINVIKDIEKNEVLNELNFTTYSGFQYAPYIVSYEFQQ